MIIGALISFIGLILVTIFGWLPSASANPLDPQFASAVDSIFTMAKQWDYLFPLSAIIWIAVLSIPFWLAMFAVSGLKWITNLIRGN